MGVTVKRKLNVLTTSSVRAYNTCKRLYRLSHDQGRRSVYTPEPMHFGGLVHRGLEAWWRAAGEGFAHGDWLRAAVDAFRDEPDPFQRARASALMRAYHERWGDMTWDGRPITVLAVEAEFHGPLINPATGAKSKTWTRAGKIDVVLDVGGDVNTLESKTTSEDIGPEAAYWAHKSIDPQVSNYHVGARMLGFESTACIFDAIRKPAIKPLLATPDEDRKYTKPTKADPVPRLYSGQRERDETPAEFGDRVYQAMQKPHMLARRELPRVEATEVDSAADVWATSTLIGFSKRLGLWPKDTDRCMNYGRACAFLPVCNGETTLEDASRYRAMLRAHEELSGEWEASTAAE